MSVPDGNQHPVIYVRIRQRRNIARIVRGQTWFWETIGSNHKRMSRSKGFHTNRDDCEASARLHFDSGTTVYLQEFDKGNEPLRYGQD